MFLKLIFVSCFIALCLAESSNSEWKGVSYNSNEVEETSNNLLQNDRHHEARNIISNMAQSFFNTQGWQGWQGSSQVLSLNLTNLFILVLLKALIFAAGSIGAGHWTKNQRSLNSRSSNSDEGSNEDALTGLTESEILLYLGYITGSPGHYACLHFVACRDPQQAVQYLTAAGLLLRINKILQKVIPYDPKYEELLKGLKTAISYGKSGGKCDARYRCAAKQNTENRV